MPEAWEAGSSLTAPPKLPWRQQSIGMRVLFILGLLIFGVTVGCFLVVGYIETAALSQPSVANSIFRHPHQVKGVIRFFTDQQESVYSIVQPLMLPAFAVLCLVGGTWNWLVRREVEKIKRKKLNRIVSGNLQEWPPQSK
jgi:ABC-type dipeptide/oligopeptide/nickel transport system permease component